MLYMVYLNGPEFVYLFCQDIIAIVISGQFGCIGSFPTQNESGSIPEIAAKR